MTDISIKYMDKIITFETLNKMFDELKLKYSNDPENSFELLNNYIAALQQYIVGKEVDFQIPADFLFSFLLLNPAAFSKVNELLKNLLSAYENTSLELEK